MSRFYVVLACIAFAGVCSAEYPAAQSFEADVQVVDDIEAFQAEYPDLKLTKLEKSYIDPLTIRYSFGRRTAGDKLVAQDSDNLDYPMPQKTQLKYNYPQDGGVGFNVTYVEINTSKIGKAYIVSGGIGQSHITIVVEANMAWRFSYKVEIFGH